MKILDANVLIAYFRENELDHTKARQILSRESDFVVLDYVLLEVLNTLLYRESNTVASEAENWILNNPYITIERLTNIELKNALELFASKKNKLSFTDLGLIVFSRSRGTEIVTFDKGLVKSLTLK